MSDTVFEACQPYDDATPVHITRIIDKLTNEEIRRLAVVLSAAAPATFETWLRRIWADRARLAPEPEAKTGGNDAG